jgi:hypothetical protein
VVYWGVGTEKASNCQSQGTVMWLYFVGYKLVPCIVLCAGVNYRGLLKLRHTSFHYCRVEQPVTDQGPFENTKIWKDGKAIFKIKNLSFLIEKLFYPRPFTVIIIMLKKGVRPVACSLILKVNLVSPFLPRSS